MSRRSPEELPSRARLLLGLVFVVGGALPILAAFDVGPLRQADIHGPAWLAALVGGIFVLAGVGVNIGSAARVHPLSYLISFAILVAFAALGNWIAFGPGPRECSIGFTAPFFGSTRAAADFECRAAFGVGAVIMDGFIVYVLAGAPKRFLGSGPFTDRLDKIGGGLLLIALSPILLPLLLLGVGASLRDALRSYRKTGKWPRNEAFILRMKRRDEEREQ